MATYDELKTLESNSSLQSKVEIAIWIAAQAVAFEAVETNNHTNRLKWAKASLRDPAGSKDDFLRYFLAANKSASLATITGSSDATVQSHVDAAIDIFADGSN